MSAPLIGVITGATVGASKILAEVATASQIDLASTLAVVIPVAGFGWYLSARLTHIEDAVNNLDCKQCPKKKDEDSDAGKT